MLKAHIESEHRHDPVYQQLRDRPDIFDQGFTGELSKVGWCRKLTYEDYALRIEQFVSGQEETMRVTRDGKTFTRKKPLREVLKDRASFGGGG
jgi:hypothetical protein